MAFTRRRKDAQKRRFASRLTTLLETGWPDSKIFTVYWQLPGTRYRMKSVPEMCQRAGCRESALIRSQMINRV